MNQNDPPSVDGRPSAGQTPAYATQGTAAEIAPPAPAATPPPERESRRLWLYFTGIFLLGTCTRRPEGADRAEMLGNLVGNGLGMMLISIVLVSVFLVWRQSTRRRIPRIAFLAALVLVPISRRADVQEKEEQFAALQRFADSAFSTADDLDPPPSRGMDARILWAARKAMEDLVGHDEALARTYGVDVDPPEAWLSAAYLADARKYPEVSAYFTRYQAYVQEADSILVPLLTERMRARLVQSGLARSQIDGFMRGFGTSAEQRQIAARLQVEFTEQALALHTYLVGVDSRVQLDDAEEIAVFARETERLYADELIGRIERLGREVEAQQRGTAEWIRKLGDSMGIKADTVHRVPSPAQPGTATAGMSQS